MASRIRLNRFRYDIKSYDNLKANIQTQYYKIVDNVQTNMHDIYIEKTSPIQAYFSHQSTELDWPGLSKVELVLPLDKPAWIHTLTMPFGGCSWIFGLVPNAKKIYAYHDAKPTYNFVQKMDGIKNRGASKILRMDEKDVAATIKDKYKVTSDWVYGTAQPAPNKTPSCVAYLEFKSANWYLNIQDTWAIAKPEQKIVDFVPQEKDRRPEIALI